MSPQGYRLLVFEPPPTSATEVCKTLDRPWAEVFNHRRSVFCTGFPTESVQICSPFFREPVVIISHTSSSLILRLHHADKLLSAPTSAVSDIYRHFQVTRYVRLGV